MLCRSNAKTQLRIDRTLLERTLLDQTLLGRTLKNEHHVGFNTTEPNAKINYLGRTLNH
ncbi:hypothetical protein LR48_Vigan07g207000 [Vigna angularis]|uniref:Uncharacterized protein n=1 Tax=Phaseolus angularis TaxID=3914 RepID=A0A0L9V081_PHAAN|nr:hypothetical protein LR48_Vigan07g207000 [Vigna angularis]